jgi:hypothetical protein
MKQVNSVPNRSPRLPKDGNVEEALYGAPKRLNRRTAEACRKRRFCDKADDASSCNQDSRRSKRSLDKERHRQLGRFSVFPISSGLEPGRSADTGTFTAAVEGPQEGNKTSVLERRTGSAAVVSGINPTLQNV